MKAQRGIRRPGTSGQTLIAAMIVLGVLLIIGFVFLGIVNRNILQAGVAQQRSVANDLAEAGIRYAHSQLLNSPLGADWRGLPTPPVSGRDPDADFLLQDPDGNPANGDQGGPDGLGAYTRVTFRDGRALIRVRYAPSDAVLFNTAAQGPLRQPGRARNFLMIESVGRVGRVDANDPTTLLGKEKRESRRLIAFASVGIIESAMFITNRDRVSRPAEFGVPTPFGLRYEDVEVNPPLQIGSSINLFNFGNPPLPTAGTIPFGGSVHSNADVVLHGNVRLNLNEPLGEAFTVAGSVRGAGNQSVLSINRASFNQTNGTWETTSANFANGANPSLDSRRGTFQTFGGVFRDGIDGTDPDGFWRNAGRKEPPSMQATDPDTGLNRYLSLTRESGQVSSIGNNGRWGHGKGVYVNNIADRQIRRGEEDREVVGSAESLVNDWFNPNRQGGQREFWRGNYYTPPGATLVLQHDGFTIIRNPMAGTPDSQRTWRGPDGTDSGRQVLRYRLGRLANGQIYVVNTLTPGVGDINALSPNFAAGQPFNGVLYFEGNVRVRGVIPTDVQLTVVSNATIYVEGSITKGVIRNTVTDPTGAPNPPARLNRPTRSMAMLMAREYVAVNTSQFFGPVPASTLNAKQDSANPVAYNPLLVQAGQNLTFRADFPFNPNSGLGPDQPNSWRTFADEYAEFGTPANQLASRLVVSHATDDGQAPYSFWSLDVNFGLPEPNYGFLNLPPNSASQFFQNAPVPTHLALYGLGGETWQRYPKFETTGFDIFFPGSMSDLGNGLLLGANRAGETGNYRILAGDTNEFTIRTNQLGVGATNDLLIARTAITPSDVRIEASMFAEEGSFAVIPGNWFNPNPNDRRDAYEARIEVLQLPPFNLSRIQAVRQAERERLEAYGAGPDTPFFGEPLAVRVQIVGAISQNMPLPMSYQGEWLRKWGWMGRNLAANFRVLPSGRSPVLLPESHVPAGFDIRATDRYVPNLILTFDPALATGAESGFGSDYLRRDEFGRPLPPMPRLPVSPALAYFGEVTR